MPRNIALVGCGAMAQAFYLQTLMKHRQEFDRIWLVDPSNSTLNEAWAISGGEKARVLADVSDELQYIIIAAPNDLHFSLTKDALARGAHVLLEKPFVICPEDGRNLANAATKYNRIIAINQTRRLFPHTHVLRRRINTGEFGQLRSIVHSEGGKLNWAVRSGAVFARDAKRTGVIMDIGVHIIDFYQVLFEPKWTLVSAIHDGFRGPEGLAEIKLTANKSPVSIQLSRYQRQKNTACLSFDDADILINIFDWNGFCIRDRLGVTRVISAERPIKRFELFADEILLNFLAAAEGRTSAVCSVASSLPVIEILDDIYKHAVCYSPELGLV